MIDINMEALYTVIVIVVLILIFLQFRWGKENVSNESYGIKKSVFTKTEFKFYQGLLWYFWSNNLFSEYTIFSKMRLIDIFYANKSFNWKENKRMVYKILAKHIDFIITDKSWAPVLLIELDDKYHSWRDYYRADELKNDICKYTWMPLIRFQASNYYDYSEILKHI